MNIYIGVQSVIKGKMAYVYPFGKIYHIEYLYRNKYIFLYIIKGNVFNFNILNIQYVIC